MVRAYEMCWGERIVCVVFSPTLFLGGWWWDIGRHASSVTILDVMFFGFPALLFVLHGVSLKAFEWGLRAYVLCYFGFLVMLAVALML